MSSFIRYASLILLFLGLNLFSHEVKAQSCPTTTACYKPIATWYNTSIYTKIGFGISITTLSVEEAGSLYFDSFVTYYGSSYCNVGAYGPCYLNITKDQSAPYWELNVMTTVTSTGASKLLSTGLASIAGLCNNNDKLLQGGQYWDISYLNCQPYANTGSGSVKATSHSDFYSKEGTAKSPDPVDLATSLLTDYKIDYKNNSPLPIVWSRTFSSSNEYFVFNYSRTATISSGVSTTTATISLTREDGQSLVVNGTRADTNSDWIWNILPDTPTNTVSPFLGTIYTDQALTTVYISTKNSNIETYNGISGKLTQIEDLHGNYLNFSYNNTNQLTNITDNTGRYLNLNYDTTSNLQTSTGPTGYFDSNGHYIIGTFNYYLSTANVINSMTPISVTDGTSTISYTYEPTTQTATKTAALILTSVTNADGTIFNYKYDTNFKWIGTLDENNNQYQTFVYNSNYGFIIASTALGTGLDKWLFTLRATYPNGTLIIPSSNINGQITALSRPCIGCDAPNDKTIAYDTTGDPITLTDFKGNVEKRTYNTQSQPLTITKGFGTPQAQTTSYTWDTRFRLPDQIIEPTQTPNGAGTLTSNYTYDNTSNLINWTKTVSNSSGYSLTHSGSATYNSFGQNLTTTDSNRNITTYTYDTQGNLISVTNPLNQTVTMGGYDTAGTIGWVQDPNGLQTSFTYNPRKQITSISKGCATGVTGSNCHNETYTITYTPTALVSKITGPNNTGIQYLYDTAHRLNEKDILDSSGNILGKEVITLDTGGTVTQDTYQNASGITIQQKNFVTDDLDRIKTFVDQEAQSFTSVRDDQNNLNSSTDPLSHGETYLYDSLNRLISTTHTDTTKELVAYGAGNEVTQQTDTLNHSTNYTYDGFGNVISKQSPDSGTSTFTYDNNSNLLSSTDARNRVITYTYDALNRELSETGSTSGETIVNTYDNCLNGIGKLCTVTDRTGVTSLTYDLWGRVLSKTEVMNGLTFVLNYAYDNNGQLINITYPSGKVVNMNYLNGNITSITDAGMPILNGATYDPWNRILGWTWNSGRQASFTYDLDGKINTMTYGSTVQTYGYDNALKINSLNQSSPAFSLNYGYDNRDRLTSSDVWGSYTYDANSNRTGLLGSLGPLTYGISPTSNQFISLNSNANVLDLSGNITLMSGKTFIYDDWSRMRSVTNSGTETDYGVNGLGERVSKKIGTNQFYYIFAGVGQLVGVYDANGLPLDETVYLGSRPVASVRGSSLSNIYPIETDNTMTPVRVIDNTDTTVWSWEGKEPFGLSQPSGTFRFNLRFPGQWYDAESGLMNNGFRDYDPVSGRYMEADPLGLLAGMNDYGYVESNSLNKTDALGLDDSFCMRDRSACGLGSSGTPDYIHFSAGIYIGTISITFTKNGSLFWGYGAAHPDPKSLVGGKFGFSLTSGKMTCDVNGDLVDGFINGYSTGMNIFYGVGGGYSVNGSGKAFEGGLGTPGVSLQAFENMKRIVTIKYLSWGK